MDQTQWWECVCVCVCVCVYSAAVLRCIWLCDHMDCSPPGFSIHRDSPGTSIRVGCHVLLQRIFPTQGLNPGLPNCRQILYRLSRQGSPRILERVACPFSRGPSWPRTQPGVSCIAGGLFTSWATREVWCVYVYTHTHTYIYIERERGEREKWNFWAIIWWNLIELRLSLKK